MEITKAFAEKPLKRVKYIFKKDGGSLYRFTDHETIWNGPLQKKIELKSINIRKKHKSVSHSKNSWKGLRAKWLTNYTLDVLCP